MSYPHASDWPNDSLASLLGHATYIRDLDLETFRGAVRSASLTGRVSGLVPLVRDVTVQAGVSVAPLGGDAVADLHQACVELGGLTAEQVASVDWGVVDFVEFPLGGFVGCLRVPLGRVGV